HDRACHPWRASRIQHRAPRRIVASPKFMDRTAWLVVALCVIGLVVWQFYLAKHMAPRPAPVTSAPGRPSLSATPAIVAPSPLPTPVAEASPGREATPSFAEKIETLRNSDVELRLPTPGAGLTEAVQPNKIAAH